MFDLGQRNTISLSIVLAAHTISKCILLCIGAIVLGCSSVMLVVKPCDGNFGHLPNWPDIANAALDFVQESVVVTDADCRILAFNPAFTKVTEYLAEEAIGKHIRLVQSGRHDSSFYKSMWEMLRLEGFWQGEVWNRRKSGEVYKEWLIIKATQTIQGDTSHYIGIAADLSRMNRVETTLENLAHHDPLTGLANRLLLSSRLTHSLERMARVNGLCAVLYQDLDRFKAVNDTYGHHSGDELLIQMATRLRTRLRDIDTVARVGGDEFVIILEGVSSVQQIQRLADDLIEQINQPIRLKNGQKVTISTSIGISVFPFDAENPEGLLNLADEALYEAKHAGRNTWRFYGKTPSVSE